MFYGFDINEIHLYILFNPVEMILLSVISQMVEEQEERYVTLPSKGFKSLGGFI